MSYQGNNRTYRIFKRLAPFIVIKLFTAIPGSNSTYIMDTNPIYEEASIQYNSGTGVDSSRMKKAFKSIDSLLINSEIADETPIDRTYQRNTD